MRLKVDLSLHNSQHFTIWNEITQGPHSARSMLHASPRWKAGGWSGLEAQCDCISQVRGCWRRAPALSQQSVVWYWLCWKRCSTSLPQQQPWERFWLRKLSWHLLPLLLFSHLHEGYNCLPLGEHSLGWPENDRHVNYTIWTWEDGENWDGYVLVPNMCIRHLMWRMFWRDWRPYKLKCWRLYQCPSRRTVAWHRFCILQGSFLWIA